MKDERSNFRMGGKGAIFSSKPLMTPLIHLKTFEYLAQHAGFFNHKFAGENQVLHDAFDFRPGAAGGVIPDNLHRIPIIFSPSSNRVE